MAKKRKQRSASLKLRILRYRDQHGPKAASEKFGVAPGLMLNWERMRSSLIRVAEADAVATTVHAVGAPRAATPSQPAPEPSNPRDTLTGLGAAIKEVRVAVIEELTQALSSKLAETVDQRMPEIVARELRKLLEVPAPPASRPRVVEPTELRPVAKRA